MNRLHFSLHRNLLLYSISTNSWEQRKLGDVLISLQNNTLSRADLSFEQGIAKNVHYGDILVKFGEVIDVKTELLPMIVDEVIIAKYKSSFLQNGDVIVADTAEDETVGKCTEIAGLSDEIVISGLHTIPYRPLQKFASGYLGYYMNSAAFHNQLLPLMQGIKVTSISKTALQNTDILYPKSATEQAAIGKYFSRLDNLITLHQRKLDRLKNIKKSMLDKMFPKDGEVVPEIRFKGFTDAWEQRKLYEVLSSYTDPVEIPRTGYERLGIRSHAKGTFHNFVPAGHELQTAQMHRVAADKFIVNITFGWEHAVAVTDENDAGKLVSHRFPQFSLSEELDPKFLKFIILDEDFRHHLWLASPGGAGRNRVLNINEMLQYEIMIPNVPEQRKIARLLIDLDNLITLHQRKLDKLKNIKKSMLDNMFV